jgi:hypothetical protein
VDRKTLYRSSVNDAKQSERFLRLKATSEKTGHADASHATGNDYRLARFAV